jgi:hypothetical protein
VSDWIGSIKDRIVVEVREISRKWLDSEHPKCLVVMETAAGSRLTWFASNPPESVTGKIRATVNTHDTYQGVRQTVVARVSLID